VVTARSRLEQAALFEIEIPKWVKLTHDWTWRPFGPSECAACLLLWFPDASRDQVTVFLTENCPVKALDADHLPPTIIYLE
jgi:hypothetical protein